MNTGIEYEATKRHIEYLKEKYDVEIREVKATIPVPLGCRKYGVPFLTKHCSEMIYRLQKHDFKWEDRPYSELIKEYPNCQSALKWWCNEHVNPSGKQSQLNINKHKLLKEFMIANPPTFKISAKCCDGAKKKPAKTMCKLDNFGLQCVGIRKLENGIRSQQYKTCFTPSDELDNYRPIFWFSDEDKEIYEKCFDVTHSDCYKVWGMTGTGCAGCPFGSGFEEELKMIEKYEPKLYKAVNKIFRDSYEYTRKYREFKEK
jgi:3'-phosphoadenosine 5'-phosphosulfate sulfotransferase (PAPS reductase)/FAD synthetase